MANNSQRTKPKWLNQMFVTLIANLIAVAQGCTIGWASPSIPILRSEASPLSSGPLSVDEAAWIVSILPIASMVGTVFYGVLSGYIGSRRALLLCAFPSIISWIITLFATLPWHLYIARMAGGLTGGGLFLCVTMFVAEIASENVRGLLCALLQFFFNTGIVVGFVAGSMLEYRTVPVVIVAIPIIFFCAFFWIPDSPQYLVKSGQLVKAEVSLRFYRNCTVNDQSYEQLKKELLKFEMIAKQSADLPPITRSDFVTTEAVRGLIIGPTLLAVAQFSGTFMLSNYAATIFSESGSTIDPNLSSIIMGCIQVIGTICASGLIDRLGRKMLLLISCFGSSIALIVTGGYSYLSSHGIDVSSLNVLPVISLSMFIFISAIGLTPVPYVIVAEVLPQNIRRIGSTIGVCSVSLFAFIMLRIFPIMLEHMGLGWCMWTFAGISAFGFLFTLLVVEETKGLNLDQIIHEPAKGSSDRLELGELPPADQH